MTLEILGWTTYLEKMPEAQKYLGQSLARVAVENKTNYILYSPLGILEGVLPKKFLHEAESKTDLPKVGDWVVIEKLPNEEKATIKEILPRATKISRKEAGKTLNEQIIAANVDTAFIVQGLDDNFNLSRLERYLLIARENQVKPVVILNKSDMAENLEEAVAQTRLIASDAPVLAVSAITSEGIDKIEHFIKPGETAVVVGSSGVGKSTLINALVEKDIQKTQEVRDKDSKGRHTTTRRELILLPDKGLLIDTPGMRELGMVAVDENLGETFADLEELSKGCQFNDCDHVKSQGCAITKAVAEGKITERHYQRFVKLNKELDFLDSKEHKGSFFNRKRKEKRLSKDIKNLSRYKPKYKHR